MGPWAKAFLDAIGGQTPPGSDAGSVEELRIEPSLITARVNGERVTLSAEPIGAGIWAALDPIDTRHQSQGLAQTLEHTWEEPLIPERVSRYGGAPSVAAVAARVAAAIEDDPAVLLRWRGYQVGATADDPWRGGELPELPAPARRPPDSVPKRFGSSGVQYAGDDVVEAFVRAYDAL